jgi:hypothetical protein
MQAARRNPGRLVVWPGVQVAPAGRLPITTLLVTR